MSRTISTPEIAPTPEQWKYVESLRRKLHLSEPLLNSACVTRMGRPCRALSRQQASDLIDMLKGWTAIPGDLLREAGQQDLWPEEQS